ncbi:MAG: hypothetical protein K9K78_02275, partial [Spirochaetales bacterium]|nr:hypothetical protein [Spirochaetales bacterium]
INAQQAMPSGGTIQVKAVNQYIRKNEMPPLEPGEYVQIDIADSGVGMPSEMLEKIFDPFFTTKQKGSGLGLATCYSIISKHDGTISVVSAPGEGTVFSIYLPRSTNTAVHSRYEGKKSHRGTGRILIMDDEKIIREVAGKMLESMGYSIVEAASGEEVLQLCEEMKDKMQNHSDEKASEGEYAAERSERSESSERSTDTEDSDPLTAAFFDLTVPGGMGGKETLTHVRKVYKKMPIFASSGYSEDPIISSPQQYGFTDSIAKPFKIEELAALLEKHLKKS